MFDNYLNEETIRLFLRKVKANWIVLFAAIVSFAGTNVVNAETEETSNHSNEIEEATTRYTDSEQEPNEEKSADKEEEKETDAQTSDDTESESEEESSDEFIMPAEGSISSEYGYRIHPVYQTEQFHAGIDIAGDGPIVAVQSGTVTKTAYDSGWGWYLKIDHENDKTTLYAHLQTDSLKVEEGDTVSQGQEIATMGTTGTSTGVHLHFEVHVNDETVDPAEHLDI